MNDTIRADEAKASSRLKKYFNDRDTLNLKIAGIARQLQCNSTEIEMVLEEMETVSSRKS